MGVTGHGEREAEGGGWRERQCTLSSKTRERRLDRRRLTNLMAELCQ
jgi:hypothetical protein